MTFFDMKVAVFVIIIANCKKCARQKVAMCLVERAGFWKDLVGMGAMFVSSRTSHWLAQNINKQTEKKCIFAAVFINH